MGYQGTVKLDKRLQAIYLKYELWLKSIFSVRNLGISALPDNDIEQRLSQSFEDCLSQIKDYEKLENRTIEALLFYSISRDFSLIIPSLSGQNLPLASSQQPIIVDIPGIDIPSQNTWQEGSISGQYSWSHKVVPSPILVGKKEIDLTGLPEAITVSFGNQEIQINSPNEVPNLQPEEQEIFNQIINKMFVPSKGTKQSKHTPKKLPVTAVKIGDVEITPEIQPLINKFNSNLESIESLQTNTKNNRQEIERLDKEIDSLLEIDLSLDIVG